MRDIEHIVVDELADIVALGDIDFRQQVEFTAGRIKLGHNLALKESVGAKDKSR